MRNRGVAIIGLGAVFMLLAFGREGSRNALFVIGLALIVLGIRFYRRDRAAAPPTA